MTEPRRTIISARRDGQCRRCRRPIRKGQPIEATSGLPGALCMMCVDPSIHGGIPKTRRPVEPGAYTRLFPEDDD